MKIGPLGRRPSHSIYAFKAKIERVDDGDTILALRVVEMALVDDWLEMWRGKAAGQTQTAAERRG